MWAGNDPRWLIPGGAFLLMTAGCLGYLLIAGEPEMEDGVGRGLTYDRIVLDTTAPTWSDHALAIARDHDTGEFPVLDDVEARAVLGMCDGELEGRQYRFPCEPGAIVITDAAGITPPCLEEECEAGIAFWDAGMRSCTILLEDNLQLLVPVDLSSTEAEPDLPADAQALTVYHEIVHCYRGKPGHTITPLFGPFASRQTGNLMHPDLFRQGWKMDGVR